MKDEKKKYPVIIEGILEKISTNGEFTLSVLDMGSNHERIDCDSLSETQSEYNILPLKELFGSKVICKGFIVAKGFSCGEMFEKFESHKCQECQALKDECSKQSNIAKNLLYEVAKLRDDIKRRDEKITSLERIKNEK